MSRARGRRRTESSDAESEYLRPSEISGSGTAPYWNGWKSGIPRGRNVRERKSIHTASKIAHAFNCRPNHLRVSEQCDTNLTKRVGMAADCQVDRCQTVAGEVSDAAS